MRWSAWWDLPVAVAVGAIVAVLAVRSCQVNTPKPSNGATITQSNPPQVNTSSTAVATGSQQIRVVIHPRNPQETPPGARGPVPFTGPGTTEPPAGGTGLKGAYTRPDDPDDWEIVIEATQSVAAATTASASAPQSFNLVNENSRAGHGRIGVLAGPFPGLVAVSFTLAGVDIPADVAGVPLEATVDLEGNASQAGVMATLGAKGYVGAGGFVSFTGSPGLLLGAGLRF